MIGVDSGGVKKALTNTFTNCPCIDASPHLSL